MTQALSLHVTSLVTSLRATCVSADRRWVVTADKGPESMVVVWDSYTGAPVKTIASPHPAGVRAMDISPDAHFVVTLSEDTGPQVLSVWDVSAGAPSDEPLFSCAIATAQ